MTCKGIEGICRPSRAFAHSNERGRRLNLLGCSGDGGGGGEGKVRGRERRGSHRIWRLTLSELDHVGGPGRATAWPPNI